MTCISLTDQLVAVGLRSMLFPCMALPSVLLLIPPLTQLNTPYPSTAYLTGFLRSRGYAGSQADLGIEMMLALFSRSGLAKVFDSLQEKRDALPGEARQMLALRHAYLTTIEPVVRFLQGRDPMLGPHIARQGFLPEGPRFVAAVGQRGSPDLRMADSDRARYRATLYLEDLMDLIQQTITPHFALNRYAEDVARSASSFRMIEEALEQPLSLTDKLLLEMLWRHVDRVDPGLVGLTVPFPGNLFGAFRIAQSLKSRRPDIRIVLGGGYVNTELRRLRDPRVFDFIDYVALDDGERPLLALLEYLDGAREEEFLCRTFLRRQDRVSFRNGCREPDLSMSQLGTPTYDDLPLGQYLSILDTANPMHRLWSDGHWNKLTVAHGCYWKQCTFCDVELDYIQRYDATPSAILVDRIESLIKETGRRGFHFVDEAAPPAGLKTMALALLEREVSISWWGNIRFEDAFTPDLCRLLAASGCIAMSAGLEAASDRLLTAMKKGITVDQTARVAASLRDAGILVHAYLMYGCPGETVEETIDSLERVRQLFACGLLQSAFWHKFTATAHSPIGLAPEQHGITITGPVFEGFAENDLRHCDPRGDHPEWLGAGLRTALFNYMEGHGLTVDVRRWFDQPMNASRVHRAWARRAMASHTTAVDALQERRAVWIGEPPVTEPLGRQRTRLILPTRTRDVTFALSLSQAHWMTDIIHRATPSHGLKDYPRLIEIRKEFEQVTQENFEQFTEHPSWKKARSAGLLLV
ncbi:MAG: radical SAM protein [Nitrospiraceae bacterium]